MDLGFYTHYKGNRYDVLHVGEHTETGEELVVYRRSDKEKVWVRPKAMFLELVEVNGKMVPRFTPGIKRKDI